jgi:hypothetical protein
MIEVSHDKWLQWTSKSRATKEQCFLLQMVMLDVTDDPTMTAMEHYV